VEAKSHLGLQTKKKKKLGGQKLEQLMKQLCLVLSLLKTIEPVLAFSTTAARSSVPTMLIPRSPSELQLEIKDPVDEAEAALAQFLHLRAMTRE